MKQLLLAGLTCLSLSATQAQDCPPQPQPPSAEQIKAWSAQPTDRGPLWRLSRDGRTSYLYGSIHIGLKEWVIPGPALQAAWANTKLLAVEIDPVEVGPALTSRPASPTLPPALAQRLAARAVAECLPPVALQPLPPMLQVATVSVFAARRAGLEMAFGLDMLLMGRARHEARPIRSLETAAQQLDALEPPTPQATHELVESTVQQLEQGRVLGPMRKLIEVWAQGDLDTLSDYASWCDCANSPVERAWLERLIDGRNTNLADRIAALHAEGQPALVVVGALHMTGPKALPVLLRGHGFTVERVKPIASEPSHLKDAP